MHGLEVLRLNRESYFCEPSLLDPADIILLRKQSIRNLIAECTEIIANPRPIRENTRQLSSKILNLWKK